ncbi:MAG TPA: type II secretion system protein [Candidatus Colwellbacteria bacterium]|nr:type II secretion system protein [Candidatus Colwellbacteria bacterium]
MKKGFTLVELLIVIAILAVLATATVVVLNPAELLAQARDSQRISDLEGLRTALGVYVSQATPITLCTGAGAGQGCAATGRCSQPTNPTAVAVFTGVCPAFGVEANVRKIDATGWVDVNLGGLAGGSPIPNLPIDPVNDTNYLYGYKADNTAKTYVLRTHLESIKHRPLMTQDGDNRNTCDTYLETTCWYSVGTDPGLDL